jgi:hypothetical protein
MQAKTSTKITVTGPLKHIFSANTGFLFLATLDKVIYYVVI